MSSGTGRNGNFFPENTGLIQVCGILFFHTHRRTAAPDIAGKIQQFFDCNHFHILVTGSLGCLFQVQLTADGKKAAKAAGDKNMEMVAVKELLNLTGYIRGGCSPVGMKKKYPTYVDETCILWEEIAVSAGARGHQMIVPPEDLAGLVDAKLADITL